VKSRLPVDLPAIGETAFRTEVDMKKSKRFDQLMALALDGDESAPGDLWLEFGYRFPLQAEGSTHE
jgi:hypothetical protein